jgi:photosystem II stability/assembly factor-like uncharacterized protein
VSSSAGYGRFCNQAIREPKACFQATTSIYRTADGGHTWRRILRFGGRPLSTLQNMLPGAWLHVFDSNRALAIATASQGRDTLFRTANGGATWTSVPLPKRLQYVATNDITFVDWRNLWILGDEGAAMGSEAVSIYRTRDAGSHWSRIACAGFSNPAPRHGCVLRSGISFGGAKTGIVFSSQSTGFLVDNNNTGIPFLYVTHDGGAHWRTESPGLPRGVPGSNPGKRGYTYMELQQPLFFGALGILPATATVCRPRHAGGNAGEICTYGRYVLLSRDGGRTWPMSRRFPFVTGQQSLVWQVTNATTWHAIVGPRLWSTHDSGLHWTAIHTRIPQNYLAEQMQFVTDSVGWVIVARFDRPDGIPRSTQLLLTEDGGTHWTAVSPSS